MNCLADGALYKRRAKSASAVLTWTSSSVCECTGCNYRCNRVFSHNRRNHVRGRTSRVRACVCVISAGAIRLPDRLGGFKPTATRQWSTPGLRWMYDEDSTTFRSRIP